MSEPVIRSEYLIGEWFTSIKGEHPCGIKIGFFDTTKEKPTEKQLEDLKARLRTMQEMPEDIIAGLHKSDMIQKGVACHCDYCEKTR